jgi:hypothetical protein
VCDSNRETLFQRFKSRADSGNRHPGHGDQDVLEELYRNLGDNHSAILEIGGPVIEVDTSDFSKIDYRKILEQISLCLAT